MTFISQAAILPTKSLGSWKPPSRRRTASPQTAPCRVSGMILNSRYPSAGSDFPESGRWSVYKLGFHPHQWRLTYVDELPGNEVFETSQGDGGKPGDGCKDRVPFPQRGRGEVLRCLISHKVTVERLTFSPSLTPSIYNCLQPSSDKSHVCVCTHACVCVVLACKHVCACPYILGGLVG